MLHTVALADVPPQPWRNGGGSTQELLAWPAAADWLVRISVARIERDGPFSAFPGIDRWFAVVDGAGVILHFAAGDMTLAPGTAPAHFDGAAAPGCTLIAGATQDLNLMVRREAGRGHLWHVAAGVPFSSDAMLRAAYTATDAILQRDDHPPMPIPAGTLVWSTDDATASWRMMAAGAAPPLRAWWVAFERVTSPS